MYVATLLPQLWSVPLNAAQVTDVMMLHMTLVSNSYIVTMYTYGLIHNSCMEL